MMYTKEERQRVERLYRKLGVGLDGTMSATLVWLPLLERIVDQLERVDVLNNVSRDYTFKEAERG